MDPLQMDSIWVEEDTRGKLYNVSLPNVEVLNSDTPILRSKNTVQLPPLPPTSYFSSLIAKQEEEERLRKKKSTSKLLDAFKMFAKGTENEKEKKQVRKKISTPFGFSHISHVDKDTTITNRTFEIPVPEPSSAELNYNSFDSNPAITSATMGVCYARTSPQRNTSTSSGSSTIPRSHSQTTSLVSNTFSNARASISTTATSRKTSLSRKPTHAHTTSTSSIEQLAKLEKLQLSKQCDPSYSSQESLDTPPLNKDLLAWDTPSPSNAVRQSWVYNFESPVQHKVMMYSTENTQLRESLLINQTPVRVHIDRFTNTLDKSFDEGPEFAEIQRDMKELNVLFGVQEPVDEGEVQEAVASLRAAKYTRMSRDMVKEVSEEIREKLAQVVTIETGLEDDEEEMFVDGEDDVASSMI